MLRRSLVGLVMAAVTVLAAAASGSAAEPTQLSAVPFGFKVPAADGWSAEVFGGMNPKTGKGAIGFRFTRRGESVDYLTTRVAFTEATATADFGPLGRLDVHSVPTGGTTTERSSCGGPPITFPAGRWEGTISFRGEEGFTSVEATSGAAAIGFLLDIICAQEVDEGIGGHAPGALLNLHRRNGTERLELTARKNKRVGPSRFDIELSEQRDGILIERSVKAEGGSGTFDFELPPGRATIAPPKPFAGALSLTRVPGSKPRLGGDLTVDFPGRAHVAVLGPGKVSASLIRAVLNPSHPF